MGTFAEVLRELLLERGMSQADLGRRLKLTPQAVSAWMSGSTPTRQNVVSIEDELAIQPRGSLLRLAGYNVEDDGDAATVESLIRADPGLDAEDKRVLLRILAMARERFAARGT